MEQISNSDLEMHIIGSRAFEYPWWLTCRKDGWDYDPEELAAPDNWVWVVAIGPDYEDPDKFDVRIDSALLRKTINAIARGNVKDVTKACVNECRNILWHPDEVDFDSVTADEVLQIAVLGKVTYG